MIQAKQKAELIVWKYLPLLEGWADPYKTQKAIKCAKIHVEGILEAIDWHEFETPNKEINYWQEVLNELKKCKI